MLRVPRGTRFPSPALDLADALRFLRQVSDASPEPKVTVATSRPRKSPARRRLALLAGFVVLGALIFVLYPRPSLFPPLPAPNGYDVLLQAAVKIMPNQKNVTELTTNELGEWVARNNAALIELRRGLVLPSAVPVRMDEGWIQAHTPNFMNLKAAARAMDAEALFLAQTGDVMGAVNEYLDLLRFGRAISRYGVLIDSLVGAACEGMAVRRMTNLLSRLNAADCKRTALVVEEIEARREAFKEIMGREKEWSLKSFGIFARIHYMIKVQPQKDIEKGYQTRVRETRLLILQLASRAFELERGRKPQRAADLVPDYLRTVPTDPATQAPLALP